MVTLTLSDMYCFLINIFSLFVTDLYSFGFVALIQDGYQEPGFSGKPVLYEKGQSTEINIG